MNIFVVHIDVDLAFSLCFFLVSGMLFSSLISDAYYLDTLLTAHYCIYIIFITNNPLSH